MRRCWIAFLKTASYKYGIASKEGFMSIVYIILLCQTAKCFYVVLKLPRTSIFQLDVYEWIHQRKSKTTQDSAS